VPDRHAPVSAGAIADGLSHVGVGTGDIVIAHSSLRSFGWVSGGAEALIDALLTAVGNTGTVCMPTLSYGDYGPARPPPPFDPATTPSIVGRAAEAFRTRPGVARSLHPTHSLAALGPSAEALVVGHEAELTPCGPGTPWRRLADKRAKVLLLGVGTRVCTLFHGPEAEVELEARCWPPVPCRLATPAGERIFHLRLHRPYRGAVSNRARLRPVLERNGLLRETRIGSASVLVLDAAGLWDLSVSLLRARPTNRRNRASLVSRRAVRRVLQGVW
jgi:aminoglycoside 3-N-acetyltransferase